jgi:hypothetical protein
VANSPENVTPPPGPSYAEYWFKWARELELTDFLERLACGLREFRDRQLESQEPTAQFTADDMYLNVFRALGAWEQPLQKQSLSQLKEQNKFQWFLEGLAGDLGRQGWLKSNYVYCSGRTETRFQLGQSALAGDPPRFELLPEAVQRFGACFLTPANSEQAGDVARLVSCQVELRLELDRGVTVAGKRLKSPKGKRFLIGDNAARKPHRFGVALVEAAKGNPVKLSARDLRELNAMLGDACVPLRGVVHTKNDSAQGKVVWVTAEGGPVSFRFVDCKA